MGIKEPITFADAGLCKHIPSCKYQGWMTFSVPDFRTYMQAFRWLITERKFKFVPIEQKYTFKFMCQDEYILFVLRWS